MQVVELIAYHVRIPFRRAIRHASHSRCETDNVVVHCVLDDGTEGFGEGVPREYVTGETIDFALELLRRSDLRAQLEPCPDFPAAVGLAERLRLAPIPSDERGCQGNAARCAVELALLDAFGRRFGQPLRAIPKLLAPQLDQPRPWVRYSGAITSARGPKLRLAAVAMWLYRFRDLKVKVGIAGYDDVARLGQLRRLMGRRIDLRVDANEAWSPQEAVARIHALEPFGISSVEQPVAHAEIDAFARRRHAVRVPIMLDESLCSLYDAECARERDRCDLFNLRLSKCGGFIPTLRLAEFASRHGVGYQLGCQVGETALLSAAGRHFASSVAGLRAVEGSYDRHLIREPLANEDLTFGWGGWARALPGSGLGVTLVADALKRVTVRKEPLFA
ncbi:MAG TPA: enolase C-terminal domain-like protein [Gemmataceae bacterium]|nr:enolase C-terminal domain-like protein [Gemmataceae bacterium]